MSEMNAGPTSTSSAAATSPTPAADGNETARPAGDANTNAAPGGETFFSGDPNSIPPQLRDAYTKMLTDYKTKTTSVADEIKKATEELSKVAQRVGGALYAQGKEGEQKPADDTPKSQESQEKKS